MEDFRLHLKMTTLQSLDPYASEVVSSAGRTALYNYDQVGETWSKTDVEGTLILYKRKANPKHMLTIISKTSKSNFIEPVTRNCDAQQKPPYVLLRNDSTKILGIWFADQSDVPRIYESISSFIKLDKDEQETINSNDEVMTPTEPTVTMNNSILKTSSDDSGDLMTMLSRAHGEWVTTTKRCDITEDILQMTSFNKNAMQHSTPPHLHTQINEVIKPSPLRMVSSVVPEETSPNCNNRPPQNNTVADFFAKVGGVGLASPSNPPLPVSQTCNDNGNNITAAAATATTITANTNNTSDQNPVLQQLFQGAAAVGGQASVVKSNCVVSSNPVSIPAPVANNCHPQQGESLNNKPNSLATAPMSLQELEGKLRGNLQVAPPSSGNILKEEQRQQQQIPFNDLLMSAPITKQQNLIAPQMFTVGTSLLDDSPLHDVPHHLTPEAMHKTVQGNKTSNIINNNINNADSASATFRIIPQGPPGLSEQFLISPHVTPLNSSIADLVISDRKPQVYSPNKNDVMNVDLSQQHSRPALTQQQFVMALSHALTKEDFVKQLYEAYEEVIHKTNNG